MRTWSPKKVGRAEAAKQTKPLPRGGKYFNGKESSSRSQLHIRMSSAVQMSHPPKRGSYGSLELRYLATSLGFPSTFILKGFESCPTLRVQHRRLAAGKPVSEKDVVHLLDSEILHLKLEKVFNKYSAKYNVKLFKKAMSLLRHRALTFGEISDARVAFELYACEDGNGMPGNLQTVQLALKMLERVMSSLRLDAEIKKYQLYSDTPSRFQLYEFLDIVAMCEKSEEVEMHLKSCSSLESADDSGSNADLTLPDFDQILMTTDQKVVKYLDEKYRESLYKTVEPAPAVLDSDHIIHGGPRRSLVSQARMQSRAITPSLEGSQSQLNRARGGYLVFSPEQNSMVNASRWASPVPRHCRTPRSRETPTKRAMTCPPDLNALRETTCCSRPSNQLRCRFQRLPRRTSAARVPVTRSHTSERDPNQPPKPVEHSESRELANIISEICVRSVVRARNLVKASFADVDSHQLGSGSSQDEKLLQRTSKPHRAITAHLGGSCEDLPPLVVPAAASTSHGMYFEPVVSAREAELQRGLVDKLHWNTLRQESRRQHRGQPDERADTL